MQNDNLARWLMFFSTFILVGAGLLVVAFASQAVATRIGLDGLHFVTRHAAYAALALLIVVVVSRLSPKTVVAVAVVVFALAFLGMIAATLFGTPIKGARRWISIAGISVQPSEFVKPALAILVCAIFVSHGRDLMAATLKAGALCAAAIGVLVLQPDVGQAALVLATFLFAGFAAGWPLWILLTGAGIVVAFGLGAYNFLSHARSRIDRFLDPESGDTYQVSRSFDAIANGGPFGVGLGEGRFRDFVPDVHADFIFASLVEELGSIGGLVVLGCFACVVVGGLVVAFRARAPFVALALSTLAVQFGVQAFINLGSTMGVIPTKGMALPLVSYGGSAMMAAALTVGFMLALSRTSVLEQKRLAAST